MIWGSMTEIINLVGVCVLLALVLYILTLVLRGVGQDRVIRQTAILEQEKLKAEIEAINAESRLVTELKELSWNGWRKFKVSQKNSEVSDICSFYLSPHDGLPLPPFKPGQFLTTFSSRCAAGEGPVVFSTIRSMKGTFLM